MAPSACLVAGGAEWRAILKPHDAIMKKGIVPKACLAVALATAGGFNATAADNPPALKFSHPREITNLYLPLATLKQAILESDGERVERTVKPDVRRTFVIAGQTVEALAVEDREFVSGKLAEVTLDYFAQADDGTVYYLGEDVDEYTNGKVTGHSGAWLLGKDTPTPGVLMPAHPRAGDRFKSEDVPRITREQDEVVSLSDTVTVPAGTYANCLKIKEVASDGDNEYKYYAPGVGCVKEVESGGELSLRSRRSK